jgi:hypothetical protein
MEGTLIAVGKRPWFQDNSPAVVDFLARLKRFGPNVIPGPASMDAWATAKTFEHATRGIDRSKIPTSQDVLAGLYALNGDDIDGLVYPLRFRPDAPEKQVVCGWPVTIGSGKATSSVDNYICSPSGQP